MTEKKEETKGEELERKDQVVKSDDGSDSETESGTTISTISETGSMTEDVTTSSTASTSTNGDEKKGEKQASTEQKPANKEQEGRRSGIQVPPNAAGGQKRREAGGPRGGEPDKDLDRVVVEMKNGRRLFIDAKENGRGKFVKLSEATSRIQSDRRSGRITMRMKVAKEVSKRLEEFIDAAEQAESSKKQEGGDEEKRQVGPRVKPLHSVTILDGGRRYFIDLLPSRFEKREPVVRITMNVPLSGQRLSITVESGEVPYIKEAFESVLENCYTEADEKEGDDEEQHTIRFGRRTYHFQPWTQARGNFVRVTEVAPVNGRMLRNSVVVPDKVLAKFAKMFIEYDAKMNVGGEREKDAETDASSTSANDGDKDKEKDGEEESAGADKNESKAAKVESG